MSQRDRPHGELLRSFIPRQSGFSGAKASETLFKFGDLILERRFLRAHDGKPLVARNDAAPLKPHVVLDALYGQAAFAQCVDEATSLGTSGVYFAVSEGFLSKPESAVHSFCHALPQRWHLMSVMLSAASCLDWAAKLTGLSNVQIGRAHV